MTSIHIFDAKYNSLIDEMRDCRIRRIKFWLDDQNSFHMSHMIYKAILLQVTAFIKFFIYFSNMFSEQLKVLNV